MADNNQMVYPNNMGYSNQNPPMGYTNRNPYLNQYGTVPLNTSNFGNGNANYGVNQFQQAPINTNNNTNNNINQYLKCRPVSSKEEAKAAQIDLDGSLWVFTDVGNEKIYTKQINPNGTATFATYQRIQDEIPQYPTPNEYVTKEEFNKVIQTLMAAMQTPDGNKPEVNDGKQGTQPALMEI